MFVCSRALATLLSSIAIWGIGAIFIITAKEKNTGNGLYLAGCILLLITIGIILMGVCVGFFDATATYNRGRREDIEIPDQIIVESLHMQPHSIMDTISTIV